MNSKNIHLVFVPDCPSLSLSEILDQDYRQEFLAPRSLSPPPPPAPIEPFALGAIGAERRVRRAAGPALVGPLAGIAADGNNNDDHHYQHQRLRHQRAQRAPAAVQAQQAPEPRPLCCSFCYGTAAQMAREMELPVPDRDAFGLWSTHSCKIDGIVTCPFLWTVICPLCGATGPVAHTRAEHL